MEWLKNATVFWDKYPKLRDSTVLMIAGFVGGFAVGVYITVLSQKQLAALGASGYIIAVFSVYTTGYMIFKGIQEWQTKRNAPTLQFNGVTMYSQPLAHPRKDYSLTVNRIPAMQGEAKNCHVYMTIVGYRHRPITSGWASNSLRNVDIGNTDDLRLFGVEEESRQIVFFNFPLTKRDVPITIPIPYDDIAGRDLTIKIIADDAKLPSPYTKKISEIIHEGDRTP